MHPTALRRYLILVVGVLVTAPVTITAQHLATPTRSAARAGLSAIPTAEPAPGAQLLQRMSGWQEAERARETDGGQWVKGGVIGAVILGGATYALANGINSWSDNPESQGKLIGISAVFAALGFVIGSLIGSGFEK